IVDQGRARREACLAVSHHPVAMAPQSLARSPWLPTFWIGVADSLGEEGEIVRRFHVVAHGLERPQRYVAVTMPLLDRVKRWMHEPLRPGPVLDKLAGEHGGQHSPYHRRLTGRQ